MITSKNTVHQKSQALKQKQKNANTFPFVADVDNKGSICLMSN